MSKSSPRILAVIPARAGSKGLPGKNIRPLAGVPLIGWSINAARDSKFVTDCVVSTDGNEIIDAALALGGETVRRPEELATDSALPKDAVLHALDDLANKGRTYEYVVLLQPTSPLRMVSDIDECIAHVLDNNLDSAASFMKCATNPYRAWTIKDGLPDTFMPGVDPWQPRQALPEAYELNGAVYVVKVETFRTDPTSAFLFGNSGATIMPEDRSHDIDTLLDFQMCEAMLADRQ